MPQLTKGMYYDLIGSRTETPFGLHYGQIRAHDFVHNGGWYNTTGELIGLGDLNPEDFTRIALELEEGELFIILGEMDTHLAYGHSHATIDGVPVASLDEEAPGIAYVADCARYAIAHGQIYRLTNRFNQAEDGQPLRHAHLGLIAYLSPGNLRDAMEAARFI